MPLQLDHTIVPAYDKVKSAEFIARIFGLKYEGPWGHFAPVKVNDILTLDFDNAKDPRSNHYAFLASDEEFDSILKRVKDEGVSFGSGPGSRSDGEINHSTRAAASTSNARTATSGKSSRTPTSRTDEPPVWLLTRPQGWCIGVGLYSFPVEGKNAPGATRFKYSGTTNMLYSRTIPSGCFASLISWL